MKKVIALVLAVIASLSVFAIPVCAQDTADDVVTTAAAVDGDAVTTEEKNVTFFDFFDLMYDGAREIMRILHDFVGEAFALLRQACPICDEVHEVGVYIHAAANR